MLSHINAPRLARRQGAGGQGEDVADQVNSKQRNFLYSLE